MTCSTTRILLMNDFYLDHNAFSAFSPVERLKVERLSEKTEKVAVKSILKNELERSGKDHKPPLLGEALIWSKAHVSLFTPFS